MHCDHVGSQYCSPSGEVLRVELASGLVSLPSQPTRERNPMISNKQLSLVAVLVTSVCLATSHKSTLAQDDVAAKNEEVRVMTYNIRYLNKSDGEDVWGKRRDAVHKTIALADVVGLQEVVKEQFEDVQAATEGFEWYGVGRDDGQEQGEMVPIGWRTKHFESSAKGTFWLSDDPDQVGSLGWDAALPRVASWVRLKSKATGKQLLVVNAHFDHRGAEARERSAGLLHKWLSEQTDIEAKVLLGDFNATRNSRPLAALLNTPASSLQLLDSHDAAAKNSAAAHNVLGPDSTWNGFKAIVPDRRIDFILVSEPVRVAQVETLDPRTDAGRFASDHLPVLADLAL